MGEEFNRRGDHCDPCQERRDPYCSCDKKDPCCEPCGPCEKEEEGWEWGSLLIILVVIFLLCGGTSWFGGGGNECCDGGFGGGFGFGSGSGSWILIILVIFLLFQGQKDGRGGFLDGLF